MRGATDKARVYLRKAEEIFDNLGARLWLNRARELIAN